MADLPAYERVSIAFDVRERLIAPPALDAVPVTPYRKDYDAVPDDRPSAYPAQFDVGHWATLVARLDGERVGGAMLAWNSRRFDMLEGRIDLAVVADLRVSEAHRGCGIGRKLFAAALDWARAHGCCELRVETQDTNVPACRFYAARGCRLHSCQRGAYGPDVDELKLVWSIPLA